MKDITKYIKEGWGRDYDELGYDLGNAVDDYLYNEKNFKGDHREALQAIADHNEYEVEDAAEEIIEKILSKPPYNYDPNFFTCYNRTAVEETIENHIYDVIDDLFG